MLPLPLALIAILPLSLGTLVAGQGQGRALAFEKPNDIIPQADVKLISYSRLDPLLTFGNVSAHMHAIVGGAGFGPGTTWKIARNSECTTMPIQTDKSNYWIAPLYYVSETKNLTAVPIISSNITYFLRPPANGSVTEFPSDFSMLGGSITRNSSVLGPGKLDDWIWYECEPTDGSPKEITYGFPKRACSTLNAVVNFPWCWNGIDYGPKVPGKPINSHVIYGGQINGTDWTECANASHPIRLPRIQYETRFDLRKFPYRPDSLALATGDTLGFHLHADYLNGWPVNYLKDVFDVRDACRNYGSAGSGNASACTIQLADVDRNAAQNCKQKAAQIPNEPVGFETPLQKFPGCNPGARNGLITPCGPAYDSQIQPELVTSNRFYGTDQFPVYTPASPVVPQKKKNLGAIIGGTLGGLALLALLALAFFLFRGSNSRSHSHSGLSLPSTSHQPPMSSTAPWNAQSPIAVPYDPHAAAAESPKWATTPSPTGQQPQQQGQGYFGNEKASYKPEGGNGMLMPQVGYMGGNGSEAMRQQMGNSPSPGGGPNRRM